MLTRDYFAGMNRMLKMAESSPLQYPAFIQGVDKLREGGSLADFRDKKNYDKCKAALLEKVMANTDIVITTPLNAAEMLRRKFFPQYIIFDEASFFRDPELIYAMSVIECATRVLMVGDHKQLSPPVFTSTGKSAWQISCFERLLQAGYHSCTLNVQYRAHNELYNVTSMMNYDGLVQTHESVFFSKFRICNQNFYRQFLPAAVACRFFAF
jgi:superfamily I DNA and/or RNA helicase